MSVHPQHVLQTDTLGHLLKAGKKAEAEVCARRILEHESDQTEALHVLGLLAYGRGDYPSALHWMTRAHLSAPRHGAILNDLGLVLMALNRLDEAIQHFKRAATLLSTPSMAHNNMAIAYKAKGQIDAAILSVKTALTYDPKYPKALFCMADLLHDQGDVSGALDYYQKAIETDPGYMAAYNRLAVCLAQSGRIEQACQWLNRALTHNSQCTGTLCNLGNILRIAAHFDEAVKAYRKAIARQPDFAEAHFNLALVYLQLENFASGWPEYEWRLHQFPPNSGYPNRYGLPLWQGQDLSGKTVLVYDEQGFGDVFMFLRFLKDLKSHGARIVFETRRELQLLLTGHPWVNELIIRHDNQKPDSVCDFCIPLCSLPGRFHTTIDSLSNSNHVPYLTAGIEKNRQWAQRIGNQPVKIGLVWSGSDVDPSRRCQLAHFEILSSISGIRWFGLQKNPAQSELEAAKWIINLGRQLHDFSDTAAVIANLDLIISIDTAVAHLAGAMGKPVWTLLPHVPDWRWFLRYSHSPWYPTMRLYRQSTSGVWQQPLAQLFRDLKQWLSPAEKVSTAYPVDPIADGRVESKGYFNQGQFFHSQGDFLKAQKYYKKALALDSGLVEAHYNLGIVFYEQNKLSEAADCYRNALALKADFAEAAYNLGIVLEDQGKTGSAIQAYHTAIELRPSFSQAAYNLGRMLRSSGRLEEAIDILTQAVLGNPGYWQALNELGLAYHLKGELDRAIDAFQQAIRLKPDFIKALHNLGNVYLDLNRPEMTISYYKQALELNGNDARAQLNMGKLYQEQLDPDSALHHFSKAIALEPDLIDGHLGMATCFFLKGEFLKGWDHYQWRLKSPGKYINIYPYRHQTPIWKGELFPGRPLLVHAEQGAGDTIQFARFIPRVKQRGGKVILEVQQSLLPLFHGFSGVDELRAIPEKTRPFTDFDWHIPIMSLPHCLRIEADQIGRTTPYIFANGERAAVWKSRLNGEKLRVGIVWAGNPIHKKDKLRSCNPVHFRSLQVGAKIAFYGLQKDADPVSCDMLKKSIGLESLGADFKTFADTAAVIENLDLTISVDTAVAHLAGAMGKPVWILLPYLPDWRWMLGRTDSPWYPSMRLFRQPRPGNWEAVFRDVRAALQNWVREHEI